MKFNWKDGVVAAVLLYGAYRALPRVADAGARDGFVGERTAASGGTEYIMYQPDGRERVISRAEYETWLSDQPAGS